MRVKKHISLANFLAEQIIAKKFSSGEKLPSLDQMTSCYQVSRSCLHLALNLLSERGMIERFPGKGIYVARQQQQVFRQLANVGCVMPDYQWYDSHTEDNYGLDIFWGISEELHARGLGCQLIRLPEDKVADLPRLMKEFNVDSLILDHRFANFPWDTLAGGLQAPAVFAGYHGRVKGIASIIPDYFTALQELGDRMVMAGKHSLCLFYPGNFNLKQQFVAAQSALHEIYPQLDFQLYDFMEGAPHVEKDDPFIFAAVRRMVEKKRIPDVIAGHNDWNAKWILEALHYHKISVPEQVGLIGFLGLGVRKMTKPSLSSFTLDAREMGRKSVALLCKIAAGGLENCSILEKMSFCFEEAESTQFEAAR